VSENTYIKRQFGPIEFIRRARRNQLELFLPEMFSRNLLYRRIFLLRSFLVIKPDYIEQVLLTNQANFVKSHFVQRLLGPLLGEGLLTSEGEVWRLQRRIAAPAFNHKAVEGFVEIMAAASADLVERWHGIEPPFDLSEQMMGLTLEIIAKTMFSTDVREQIERVRRLVQILVAENPPSALDLFGLPQWLPRPKAKAVRAVIREFDRLVAEILAPRRDDRTPRGDLLALLMQSRDPETGEAMSDKELRDQIITIFLAGHETTANALSFAWWLLAENPAAEARMHEEIDRVLAGRRPGFADLPNLRYTRMVFEETLRLYPPAHSISRRAVAADVIGGVTVPANSVITISPYVTHRNPELWPDPDRFDPERFAPDRAAARHRFAYLPFGGGPRICIGQGFAIAEAQVILASIAQSFRVKLVPGHKVEPRARVTLRPATGVLVTLEPRVPSP
jgi:cytochrome P450